MQLINNKHCPGFFDPVKYFHLIYAGGEKPILLPGHEPSSLKLRASALPTELSI